MDIFFCSCLASAAWGERSTADLDVVHPGGISPAVLLTGISCIAGLGEEYVDTGTQIGVIHHDLDALERHGHMSSLQRSTLPRASVSNV